MPVRERRHDTDYRQLLPLFRTLADPTTPDRERARVREAVLRGHLPLAEHIARRYQHRGQPADDLDQVARLGLILAVDRFDPWRGNDFLAFAVPTIIGEVRRYFRDLAWALTVPRRLKDQHLAIVAATAELAQELGRSPRPRQLAARLDIPLEELYEGLQAGYAYRTETLDGTSNDDSRGLARLGQPDRDLDLVDDREALYPALARLPAREASIVIMRFFEDLTQTEIARRIGLSQVHVSRLLSRSLAQLRNTLADEPS
jgi:RNA polymerase sigma-B factor